MNFKTLFLLLFILAFETGLKAQNEKKYSMKEAVLTTIQNRKSVRHFVSKKMVSKEDLLTLVKAGMAAPSAMNIQPWSLVVISKREMLDSLAKIHPHAAMLEDAGAAILVCGDTKKSTCWIEDCSAVTENILLATEAMGLGAVWTGLNPPRDFVKEIKKMLGVPENITPLSLIVIGYPTGQDKPKDKWKEEKVHWGKW